MMDLSQIDDDIELNDVNEELDVEEILATEERRSKRSILAISTGTWSAMKGPINIASGSQGPTKFVSHEMSSSWTRELCQEQWEATG